MGSQGMRMKGSPPITSQRRPGRFAGSCHLHRNKSGPRSLMGGFAGPSKVVLLGPVSLQHDDPSTSPASRGFSQVPPVPRPSRRDVTGVVSKGRVRPCREWPSRRRAAEQREPPHVEHGLPSCAPTQMKNSTSGQRRWNLTSRTEDRAALAKRDTGFTSLESLERSHRRSGLLHQRCWRRFRRLVCCCIRAWIVPDAIELAN